MYIIYCCLKINKKTCLIILCSSQKANTKWLANCNCYSQNYWIEKNMTNCPFMTKKNRHKIINVHL